MSDKAVVFAGQGAQFVGMAKDLVEAYPACKALFDTADEILGYSLSSICFEGPEQELTKTSYCQPGIFVASTVCYRAYQEAAGDAAVTPLATAGLSLGEWSALHMAGALSFEATLKALEARGRFMQEACDATDGSMVSIIGLSREQIDKICAEAGVEIGNINSSAQIVLSGPRKQIEEAEKMAVAEGAKRAIVLKVAGAYHSTLMNSAAEKLAAYLEDVEFLQPELPVLSNVTGAPHVDPPAVRENMIRQVTSSVQWQACIDWCQANGVAQYMEFGPGRVLSGLIKRIAKGAALSNVQDMASLQKVTEG